jgi:hypothetical protein
MMESGPVERRYLVEVNDGSWFSKKFRLLEVLPDRLLTLNSKDKSIRF